MTPTKSPARRGWIVQSAESSRYKLVYGRAMIEQQHRTGVALIPREPAATIHFFELLSDKVARSSESGPRRHLRHFLIPRADFKTTEVVLPEEVILKTGIATTIYSIVIPDDDPQTGPTG